jgi:hypothetical protein
MPNIIQVIKSRRNRWVGYVPSMGKWSSAFGILVRKPEGQRLLESPCHRWKNIKLDVQ